MLLVLSSLLLIVGWIPVPLGADDGVLVIIAMIKWLGPFWALGVIWGALRLRGGEARLIIPTTAGAQLCASAALGTGLSGILGDSGELQYERLVLGAPLCLLSAWWCFECLYRYNQWHKANGASAPQWAVSLWPSVALLLFLDLILCQVGDPEEPTVVRRERGKFLLGAAVVPPIAWVQLLLKLFGDPGGGPVFAVFYLGPAFLWVGAGFAWMLKTYGPAYLAHLQKSRQPK